MTGAERRKRILEIMRNSPEPVSGTLLAEKTGVSRQVVVQDIALLRTMGNAITATMKGYLLEKADWNMRLFKTYHDNERTEEELNLIVDMGGAVLDVMVNHKIYGKLTASLNIRSRRDVQLFLESLKAGKSTPLSNITSGYHFHHVCAENEEVLDEIEDMLRKNLFYVRFFRMSRNLEKQMIKAAVFDFDYTLGDSSKGIIASVNYALEKMGYAKAQEETIKKTIGLSLEKTLEALTGNEKDGALFERYFREKADEVMTAETVLYDGVAELLASLQKQGLKLAIVTTKYHYRIEQILRRNRMEHLVDEIIGGDDVTIPKPDPEGLNLLSKRWGIRTNEMLYIGDSIVDAKTAKTAGAEFTAVLTGTTGAEEFEQYPCRQVLFKITEMVVGVPENSERSAALFAIDKNVFR